MQSTNGTVNGTAKRAVLYARVSGDDRKYATSGIESQLADCRKYARERGYNIVSEYYETPDKQTSGADWLPEIEAILKLAQQSAFDVLVVREIDRLARNRFKQMSVEIQLEAHGVKVEYVIGQYEDTAEGRLLKGLMGEFAEYERQKTMQRTQRGRLRSVAAGNITVGGSKAPYGYRLNTNGKKNTLEIHETEAEIVRTIFHLYVNELKTVHGIAVYLDEHNIPQPGRGNNHKKMRTKGIWSHGTVSELLSNETYVGRWYYRKTKRIKTPDGKRRRIKRPKEEWLMVEVPAIVSEDLFEIAQRRKQENLRKKRNVKHYTYALSGILTCGYCGNGMGGYRRKWNGKVYSYYYCNARRSVRQYGFKCENPTYRTNVVDDAIWNWVKNVLLNPDVLRAQWERHRDQRTEELQPLISMVEANEAHLAALEQEKQRLIRAYTAGTLTLDEIATEKTRLDKEIGDVSQAIQELRADLEPRWPTEEEIETIERYAQHLQTGAALTDNDPEEQNKLYRLLQMEVTLTAESKDRRYVDLSCILGEARLSTVSYTSDCTRKI